MYKLKNVNGRVNALLRTGKDFVKNNLSVSAAQHIIDTGKLVESDNPDYPICIDNQWYFEGVEVKKDSEESPVEFHVWGNEGGQANEPNFLLRVCEIIVCDSMLDTTARSSTRKQTSITGRRVTAHSSRSPIMTEQCSCISIVRAIPSRTISISWRSPKVSHRTAFGSS